MAARAALLGLLLSLGLVACKEGGQAHSPQPGEQHRGGLNSAAPGADVTLKPASAPRTGGLAPQGTPPEGGRGPDGCLPDAPEVPKAPPPPLALSGRLGLWVAQVDPVTLKVIRAVGTNPDSAFPLASTYKQAVLWAMLERFDAGELSPTERFDVTRSNQSLGAYPFDGMTLRDLSTRMIQWSDNTATDIIHRRVGLQSVQDVADRLGLCKTRVILPTRTWWVMEAGLSDTFNNTGKWVAATGQERARLAALIDEDARKYRPDFIQRKLDQYFDSRYDPADDLKVHNLSTPYEFATLLAHEYLNPGLSARAVKWQRDVAQKGFGRYALKAQAADNVAWFGGKGGNGWRLLTYSGYFQTKDGRHVVYAFMQHGADETYTMPNTRRAFAWINAGIDAVIGVQTPKPKTPPVPPEARSSKPGTDAAKAKAAAVKGAGQPLPTPPLPTTPPP